MNIRPTSSQEEITLNWVWMLARFLIGAFVLWIVVGFYNDTRHEKPDVHPREPISGLDSPGV